MKKLYIYPVLGLCAAFLATACSDDDYVQTDFTRPAGGNQIFLSCQSQLGDDKATWEADSKLGFFSEQTETVNLAVGVAAPFVGQTEGLFYTHVAWNKEAVEHTFYVYSPYSKTNTAATSITGVVNSAQLQSGTSNAHIASTALTYATITTSEVETAIPVTFKHALGYLDVACTTVKYTGWKVKSIELSAVEGTPLVGSYKFNLTTGSFSISEGSSSVMLKIDKAPELIVNKEFHGYVSVNPLALSSTKCPVKIILEKTGAEDIALTGEIDWMNIIAGQFTTLALNLDQLNSGTVVDTSIDLSENETANCYIAGKAGQEYRFRATVMGNGVITQPVANYDPLMGTAPGITPKTLAPTSVNILWQTKPGLIYGVQLKNDYAYFTLNGSENTPLEAGNAVIAAYAEDGTTILWSWHIWVTDVDLNSKVETYTIHSDYNDYNKLVNPIMMDRNLGALTDGYWAVNNNNKAQGMRYQWGRKDPFPERNDASAGTTTILTTYNKDGKAFDVIKSLSAATDNTWGWITTPIAANDIARYPMCYIASGAKSWLVDGGNDLWGNANIVTATTPVVNESGSKTIYDPCPPGYRVPHAYVWTGFVSNAAGGKYSTNAVTVNVNGTMADFISHAGGTFSVGATPSYATSGYVNNASFVIKNPANRGQSWSNSPVTAANGCCLMYDTANFFPLRSQARSYGYPVRCMKENTSN